MDSSTIEKIAELARLEISKDEAQDFANHFNLILGHFKNIEKVNTQDIAPLITPSPISPHMREDLNQKKISSDEALSNAPEKSGYLFKVPPVVGG